jgi:hypothetical protein
VKADVEYVAVNQAGVPQFALTKVTESTFRFYNAVSGQRIALVQEDSGFFATQFNIFSYTPVCATQSASSTIQEAYANFSMFLRYTLVKGGSCTLTTCWTASRASCDSQAGDNIWEIATSDTVGFSWDYDFFEASTSSPQVGKIFENNAVENASDEVYSVWLAAGQDQALGVLTTMLVDFTDGLASPSENEQAGDTPGQTPAPTVAAAETPAPTPAPA